MAGWREPLLEGLRTTTGPRRPPRLWWLVLGVTGLLLWALGLPATVDAYDVSLALAFVAVTVHSLALPLALVRPLTATALQFGAAFALTLDGNPVEDPTWPFSVVAIVALVVNQGVVGLRRTWFVALGVWWAGVMLCVCLVLADDGPDSLDNAEVTLIVYTVISALVLAVTVVWQQRGEVRRELAEAQLDVHLEQSRRAVVLERARIARELHDVVAHSMSVIHMQASSAPYRLTGLDDEARGEFTDIAQSARQATREMRRLLGVLRDEGSDVRREPAPGLGQVAELVRSVEHAGVTVRFEPVALEQVPETVGVVAYRVVQEALSNVVRHAPGAAATVQLRVRDGDLLVGVVNSAPPLRSTGEPPVEDRGPHRGHGLRGMRERAELTGGSVDHGPTETGGFQVRARLPLSRVPEEETPT